MTELDIGLGNRLYRIVQNSIGLLFSQGELAQLSHSSFHDTINSIKASSEESHEISYPVGYIPSKESIVSSTTYSKEELSGKYNYLMHTQLPISGVFQLSMIMEVLFSSVIREVVREFPNKISSKKQVPVGEVLKAKSLEEVHLSISDKLLNELSYKSPREFAEEAEQYISINLLECAAYHSYIEMKSTRDILIHNYGIANETYVTKSGTHARAKPGEEIPISQIYFLEVYESCLRICEWLQEKLHERWHSSEFAERQASKAAHNNQINPGQG